ncbi:hypothetical protein AB0A73_22125 [Glycomyces sp. NPDC047369]
MDQRTRGRERLAELVAAADSVLALPEAGAIATQMALRSPTIGRWSLRSQCLLSLQEHASSTTVSELGTRDAWLEHGHRIRKRASGFYVLSTQNRERGCFRVFTPDQTRAVRTGTSAPGSKSRGPGAVWLRTLRRELGWCGYALELAEGETVHLEVAAGRVVFAAERHTTRKPLEALAQVCADLTLVTPARRHTGTRAALHQRTAAVPGPQAMPHSIRPEGAHQ